MRADQYFVDMHRIVTPGVRMCILNGGITLELVTGGSTRWACTTCPRLFGEGGWSLESSGVFSVHSRQHRIGAVENDLFRGPQAPRSLQYNRQLHKVRVP